MKSQKSIYFIYPIFKLNNWTSKSMSKEQQQYVKNKQSLSCCAEQVLKTNIYVVIELLFGQLQLSIAAVVDSLGLMELYRNARKTTHTE